MGFETESALSESVRPKLREKFGNEHTEAFKEFSYGGGRTDYVLARVSPKYLTRRIEELGLGIPILKRSFLKTFIKLHRRGKITKQYFVNEISQDRSAVRSALRWLVEKGFVTEDSGKISTVPNIRRHTTTTYAFEFKLDDWKRALKQAFRAKTYAKYQFVVLDADYIERAKDHVEKFEKYNVGLLSANTNGEIRVVREADREKPFTPLSEWSLNEAILERERYKKYHPELQDVRC